MLSMDGSWRGQNAGLATSGWMPMYNMAGQMGYGQQQPQAQQSPYGNAPPLGMSPPGQGAPQQPMQGQGQFQPPGGAPQFPQNPQAMAGYGLGSSSPPGASPMGTSVQGAPAPQLPQGTAQGFPQGYGKPLSMSNFLPQQGRQIMGNPTSTFVGQGGIASALSSGQSD